MKKVVDLNWHLAMKNDKGDFFVRGIQGGIKNLDLYTAGCRHYHHGHEHQHGIEVSYDNKNKDAGILGHPVFFRFLGQYQFTPSITFKTLITAKKEVEAEHAWIQKIDSHLKIVGSHKINLTKLYHGEKDVGLEWGMKATWNLPTTGSEAKKSSSSK